ncbi:hypothetical protein Hanom_Chr08g00686491 [Helianthus anomalus]
MAVRPETMTVSVGRWGFWRNYRGGKGECGEVAGFDGAGDKWWSGDGDGGVGVRVLR